VTPQLLKQHSITADEYQRILSALGRTPSLTELRHLQRDVVGALLLQVEPGALEEAADQERPSGAGTGRERRHHRCWRRLGLRLSKIESHNHPSYIEPFQARATGVGGILRDIFTMGARPLAVMDSLRFGPITEEPGV